MIRKAWRSNVTPVTLPRIWSPTVEKPLTRICHLVSDTLKDCKKLRHESAPWVSAFDALINIAESNKRHLLRPQLVLLGHYGSSGKILDSDVNTGVEEFAAGVELHHLFTFIHDDVMDSASLRRGLPTVNAKLREHGIRPLERVENLTIIIGDIVQARAMDLFARGASKNGRPGVEAWKLVLEAAQRSGASQFEDVLGWRSIENFSNNLTTVNQTPSTSKDNNTIRKLLERHVLDKTAYQGFISPLLAGLHLGSDDKPISSELYDACTQWGYNSGLAYQILDDVSELILSPMETGKDSLRDMRDGRLSVPLFLLREQITQDEWKGVESTIKSNFGSAFGDRRLLSKLVEETGIARHSLDMATERTERAEKQLLRVANGPLRDGLTLLCKGLRSINDDLSSRLK